MEVNPHPNAEKLYLLKVNIGEKDIQLVAGIKPFYAQEELVGKRVIVLVNLEPKDIRGSVSEGMVLAASGKDDISLIAPDKEIALGSAVR